MSRSFRSVVPLLSIALGLSSPAVFSTQGSQKVEFLLKNLESDSDYKVRVAAANALGKIADGTVVDWMIRAFRREKHSAVRLSVLYAIAEIPDHRGIPPLLELVQEELLDDKEMIAVERIVWNFRSAIDQESWTTAMLSSSQRNERAIGAWLLGLVGDDHTLSSLEKACRDRSPIVRLRAVQAVGRIGFSKGSVYCKERLRADSEPMVRQAAELCLGQIDLIQRKRYPMEKSHRVSLKTDLYGLEEDSVTVDLFRRYQQKNVNPREVDIAMASLAPQQAEWRNDKTIPLIEGEFVRQTFRMDADLVTTGRFTTSDLNHLRDQVRDKSGYVNHCYVDAQKTNRKLGGTVEVSFKIAKKGNVKDVAINGGTLKHAQTLQCIRSEISRMEFRPLPMDMVKMQYTFLFVTPKDQQYKFGN